MSPFFDDPNCESNYLLVPQKLETKLLKNKKSSFDLDLCHFKWVIWWTTSYDHHHFISLSSCHQIIHFRSRFDLDLSDLTDNIPLVPSQTNTNQSNTNAWTIFLADSVKSGVHSKRPYVFVGFWDVTDMILGYGVTNYSIGRVFTGEGIGTIS